MRVLAFHHSSQDHGGAFKDFFIEDGHEYVSYDLSTQPELPLIDNFDALAVFGGAMNVWEEDKYPWMKEEKAYISKAVKDKGVPYLGVCLGHQLLCDALGGAVEPMAQGETGINQIMLTEAGASSVLFDGFNSKFDVLEWHGAEITKLPQGAQILATSPLCTVQAMQWETRAASIQFHLEINPALLEGWLALPEYRVALCSNNNNEEDIGFLHGITAAMTEQNNMAERFYINWLQMAAAANRG